MLTIAIAMVSAVSIHSAVAQGRPRPTDQSVPAIDDSFCAYPAPKTNQRATPRALTIITESEPNNSLDAADIIPLSVLNPDIDVTGYNYNDEDDYFAISLKGGDILGVACRGSSALGGLDPQIKLLNSIGNALIINDDGLALYPVTSPMPVRAHSTDSMLTFIAPHDGLYHILVEPFPQTGIARSQGSYTLQLRIRRNVFESEPTGTKQIIFVDFDGATIPAQSMFGGTGTPVNAILSPLSSFLGNWGLTASDENRVINAILIEMTANFNFVTAMNPGFKYELRNSRDNLDTFGIEPHVSRVIIGGTAAQLGIGTIGIAESVDPGNFDTSETGLLLLGDLSDTNPANVLSLNNVLVSGGATNIDLIGTAVGNMAAHEVGHTLGNWHTDPNNSLRCIMDSGGASTLSNFRQNYFEVGADGIFGNADDNESDFIADLYFATEYVGMFPSISDSTVRTAFAMSGVPSGLPCPTDLNNDGVINGLDLGILLGTWGACP
jgi:hypothetical protein